ncbi:MAG: hypothetical protein RLY86_2131 [Pseudomonadota bacterium]|jgi:hypothetical protein
MPHPRIIGPALLPRLLALALLTAAPLALTACDNDGPAEETGEAIDNATKDAADRVEDAGEAVKEQAEEARESVRPRE